MDSPSHSSAEPNIDPKVCPNCGSADIRSTRSIYDTAKSYARSSISRVAVTGGAGFYLDGSNVRPTPETLMAAKFPPPEKPKFSWWWLSLTVLCAAFLYFCLAEWVGISAWLALAISAAWVVGDYLIRSLILPGKLKDYRERYDRWEKTRVCLNCETAIT
jgi:hypothetical protein